MKFKPVLFSLPKIPSKKILLIPQDETNRHYLLCNQYLMYLTVSQGIYFHL